MNPARRITPLTLSLVEGMATDPRSPRALRQFHAASLTDLRARAERQDRPARPNPFDRYIEKLTEKEP